MSLIESFTRVLMNPGQKSVNPMTELSKGLLNILLKKQLTVTTEHLPQS